MNSRGADAASIVKKNFSKSSKISKKLIKDLTKYYFRQNSKFFLTRPCAAWYNRRPRNFYFVDPLLGVGAHATFSSVHYLDSAP